MMFIEVELEKKEVRSFIGKLPFSTLIKAYSLSPRREISYDPFVDEEIKQESFQREFKKPRIREIAEFIIDNLSENRKEVIFPSPILLGCLGEVSGSGEEVSITKIEESLVKVSIPGRQDKLLIIDGQHRFVAFKAIFERDENLLGSNLVNRVSNRIVEVINDIEIPVVLFWGNDINEYAKIFIRVNFEAKKVDKSLFYDVFGSLDPSTDEDLIPYRISRDFVYALNNNKASPLRNSISILGNKRLPVSQGFLVERLYKFFVINQRSGPGIFYYITKSYDPSWRDDDASEACNSLIEYFASWSSIYKDYWYNPEIQDYRKYKHYLSKSMFIGSMLEVYKYLYLIIVLNKELTKKDFYKLRQEDFFKFVKGVPLNLFQEGGEFSKGTGGQTESLVFTRLIEVVLKNLQQEGVLTPEKYTASVRECLPIVRQDDIKELLKNLQKQHKLNWKEL